MSKKNSMLPFWTPMFFVLFLLIAIGIGITLHSQFKNPPEFLEATVVEVYGYSRGHSGVKLRYETGHIQRLTIYNRILGTGHVVRFSCEDKSNINTCDKYPDF